VPAAAVRQKMGLRHIYGRRFLSCMGRKRGQTKDEDNFVLSSYLELLDRLCRMTNLGVKSREISWKNNCED